jgi:hypothetical protein
LIIITDRICRLLRKKLIGENESRPDLTPTENIILYSLKSETFHGFHPKGTERWYTIGT